MTDEPILKNIVFGIAIVIFFFFCAEITLRILLPFPMSPRLLTYEVSDTLDFRHKPNSMSYQVSPYKEYKPVKLEYNKYGFRGSYEKIPENKELIIILGDSYVDAEQVPFKDSMPEILNSKYKNKFFVNAGVGRYGTMNEYWLLKYHIFNLNLKPKPSRIFLFFCFNDYTNDYKYYYGKQNFDLNIYPEPSYFLRTGNPISPWLERNLAIYANLNNVFKRSKSYKPINPKEPIVVGHPRRINPTTILMK